MRTLIGCREGEAKRSLCEITVLRDFGTILCGSLLEWDSTVSLICTVQRLLELYYRVRIRIVVVEYVCFIC